jgi:hypothetical protein
MLVKQQVYALQLKTTQLGNNKISIPIVEERTLIVVHESIDKMIEETPRDVVTSQLYLIEEN